MFVRKKIDQNIINKLREKIQSQNIGMDDYHVILCDLISYGKSENPPDIALEEMNLIRKYLTDY